MSAIVNSSPIINFLFAANHLKLKLKYHFSFIFRASSMFAFQAGAELNVYTTRPLQSWKERV
eukprot:UN08398